MVSTTCPIEPSWIHPRLGSTLYSFASAVHRCWRMEGALFLWLDWQVLGTGDFNGDGKADILWRNVNASAPDAGKLYLWMMDGPKVIGGAGYTNSQADFTWDLQSPR